MSMQQLEASRNDAAAVRRELEDRVDEVGALKDEAARSPNKWRDFVEVAY